ncbi:MAG: type II toxin-antitoxin system PemK/MazF family toxin [Coriobacteriia bacterium]|nr:type II toxin-antitoxin system PemK/MazF family toxin [Coriobacteriia bacterium]
MVTPGTDRGVRRGQVYWVDFGPAKSSVQAGRRPVLVVQNDVGNRYSPNTIVVAMTTRIARKDYPTEVRLPDELFGKPSVVRCGQMLTVAQDRLIGAAIASLDPATMSRVDTALQLSLGL